MDLQKAAGDCEGVHFAIAMHANLPGGNRRYQRHVARKNAKFAGNGGKLNHVRRSLEKTSFRRHHFQLEHAYCG